MNEPITRVQLEFKILENVDLLSDATDHLAEVLLAASSAEHAHKLSRAIAYRSAEGTVPEKEARVDQITERELRARLDTDAIARAAREALDSRRVVLSALQSLLRSVVEQT